MVNNKRCDWFKTPVSDDEELTIIFVNDSSFRVCSAAKEALMSVLDADGISGVRDPRIKQRSTHEPTITNTAQTLLDIETGSGGLSDAASGQPEIDPEQPTQVAEPILQPESIADNNAVLEEPAQIRIPDNPNAPIPPQSPNTVKTIMEQAYKQAPGTLDALSPGQGSRAANERLRKLNEQMSNDLKRQAGHDVTFKDDVR